MKNAIKLLLPIAAIAFGAFAQADVTSLADIDNATVVSIVRRPAEADTCGYLTYIPGEGQTTLPVATSQTLDDNALWVIYYNSADNKYFLYNIGAQMCVNTASSGATFSQTATAVTPTYIDSKNAWTLTSNSQMLGLTTSRRAAAYFLQDMTADDGGFFFTITTNDRQLSDDEKATMAMQVYASRNAQIEAYRAMLQKFRNVNADGLIGYCGTYDLDAFAQALDNADTTPIDTIEMLAQQTILSALPQPGCYYRIKNIERPTNNSLNNYMTLKPSGKELFVQNSTLLSTQSSTSTGENLRLFQFEPVASAGSTCYRLRQSAAAAYLNLPGISSAVQLVDASQAAVFNLTRYDYEQRLFLLRYNGTSNVDLTSNGSNGGQTVVPYNVAERPQRWYIEKVEQINGPTLDANGWAGVELPCHVTLPEGVTAYSVNHVEETAVALTAHQGVVAAYTPMIIKGQPGTSVVFTIATDTASEPQTADLGDDDEINILSGVTMSTTPTDPDRYVLAVVDGATVLKLVESTAALSADTVYLDADLVKSGNPTLDLIVEHISTGVDTVTTDTHTVDSYDLLGRPVSSDARGRVVVNSDGTKTLRR
jgi:hypothetical protein